MGSVHLLLILCPTILLTFLMISLSRSVLPVSKQHNLFLSTYEFIVVQRSGRVAVFFMFNVIAITNFLGSLKYKPASTEDSDGFFSFPHLVYGDEGTHDEATWKEAYDDVDSDMEDGNEYHAPDHDDEGYDEDSDDDGSDDELDSEDEEDKDLERRIEEFIAKNYRQRREELIHERLDAFSIFATMRADAALAS